MQCSSPSEVDDNTSLGCLPLGCSSDRVSHTGCCICTLICATYNTAWTNGVKKNLPIFMWKGLIGLILNTPLLSPPKFKINNERPKKSDRLLMKADNGTWWLKCTGQVGLVLLCPDLNRLTHLQSLEVLKSYRLPLEGQSRASFILSVSTKSFQRSHGEEGIEPCELNNVSKCID